MRTNCGTVVLWVQEHQEPYRRKFKDLQPSFVAELHTTDVVSWADKNHHLTYMFLAQT